MASSESAYGFPFSEGLLLPEYLPIDEAHPATPRDPYGLGKRVVEETAAGFGRMDGPPTSISTLRFPNVDVGDSPERYAERDYSIEGLKRAHSDPSHVVRSLSYVHASDATALTRRALETDLGGHETFWVVADDTTSVVPTAEIADEFYPDAERTHPLTGTESLISNEKAKRLLDWEPERSWRDF